MSTQPKVVEAWKVHQGLDYICVLRPFDDTNTAIRVDNIDDARLIAAAPLLYAEAFKLIGDLDPESGDRRFDGLRAAIAAATGEQNDPCPV